MKVHSRNPFLRRHLAASLLALAVISCSGGLANAASGTWNGGSTVDGNWSNVLNWVGGTAAPGATTGTANTDIATFNAAIAHAWGLTGTPIVTTLNLNLAGISFDTAAGNYFIGTTAGNAIKLSSGGTIGILSTLTATNAIETINAPLAIQGAGGTYTFSNNSANGAGAGAGTLNIGGGITGGATGATVLTLNGSNTNSNTISGIIANGTATSLAVTKTGAGTWLLSGTNTFTGALTVEQGTLSYGNWTNNISCASNLILGKAGDVTGTLEYTGSASTVTSTQNFTLATGGTGAFQMTNSAGVLTLSGVIDGSGGLTKTGDGRLSLSGANTYTGKTLISAGTLTLRNSLALQNSVLDTSGAGNIVAYSATYAAQTFGGLTSATPLTLDAYVTGLTLNPGTGTTNTYAGALGSTTAGMTLTMSGMGTQILSGTNTFTGATTLTSGTLSVGASANLGNANSLVFNGGTLQITGTTLNSYAAAKIGTHTVTQTATKAIKFDIADAGNNFTVSQNLVQTSGGLTKSGAGTLTLSGTGNTFTGLTTVAAGTLAYGVANALSTGAVTVSGGELSLGNYSDSVGTVTLTSGSITGTGTLTSTGTFDMQSGTVSAILDGSGIVLNKSTAGTVTLAAANTYTGLTTVSLGTLAYGVNNALSSGAVTVNGGTLDISTFSDSVGAVILTSGSITGTTGVLSGTGYTLNGTGTVSAILGGTAALTANTGVSTLTGANTYSGATMVTSGALNIQNATALGTSAAGTAVSIGASLQLQGGITVADEALTLSGLGNYFGALRNISGNNTYGGLVTLGATTRITSDADSLTLSNTGTITGATFDLTVYGAGNTTINSIIGTTTGTLAKYDAGTLTLTGANTYTGATTVNAGVLNIQNNTATGTTAGGVTVTSGAALQIQGNITVGAEVLALSGTGINNDGALRNISGNNTYGGLLAGLAGATRINSDVGTLTFSNLGSWTGSAADLTFGGAGNTTINSVIAPISGSTLTKDGGGTLTLTGANTYAGATAVSAGVLNIQDATALGLVSQAGTSVTAGAALQIQNNITVTTETLTLNGGGISNDGALRNISGTNVWQATVTLGSAARINSDAGTLTFNTAANSINGTNQNLTLGGAGNGTVGGTITTGTGTLTKDGAGIWTISGTTTYTGLTTVSEGTLTLGHATDTIANTAAVTVSGGTLAVPNTDTVGAVTLSSGTISGAGTLTGSSYALTNSGTVSAKLGGAGIVLTKTGAGAVTLSGANTYTGTTTVSAGTLVAGAAAPAAASGAFGNAASAIILGDAATASNYSSPALLIGGAFTVARGITIANQTTSGSYTIGGNTADSSTFAGAIALNQALTVTASTGGTVNLTKSISNASGTNTVTVTGAGSSNVVLNNATANQFAPTLFAVTSGKLSLGASSQIADATNLTVAGGEFAMSTYSDTVGTVTLASGTISGAGTLTGASYALTNSGTVSAILNGTGALTKTGAGTATLSGSNSYTDLTTVSTGTLEVTVNNALGTNAAGTTVTSGAALKLTGVNYATVEALSLNGTGISSGGALVNSGTSTFAGAITAASNASINAGGGTLNLTGGLVKDGTILTLTGGGIINVSSTGISGSSANSDLVVDGTTVNLGVASTYNGPTYIRNGGTLNANVTNALPTANGRTAVTFDGSGTSTLALGADQAIASLTGALTTSVVTLDTHTLTIGTTTGSTTFAGAIGGTGGLIKDGGSTQVLSGANSYSGGTAVNAGKLVVNGSLAAGAAVIVGSSGTLTGSGTIHSATTVSGTLAPGISPTGLTIGGTTTFNSGSIFDWQLDTAQSNQETNRGVAYSGINTSAVAGGSAVFQIALTGTQDFSDTFWDQSRSWADIYKTVDGSAVLAGDWTARFNSYQYFYNGKTAAPTSEGSFALSSSNNKLTWTPYTAVPEVSNVAIGMLLAGGLLRRRRKNP